MNAIERERIEAIVSLCAAAREQLGADGSFRARVLLDMVLLELKTELAKHIRPPSG